MHCPLQKTSLLFFTTLCLFACKGKKANTAVNLSSKDEAVQKQIKNLLAGTNAKTIVLKDSSNIIYPTFIKKYYSNFDNEPVWSSKQKFTKNAISLINIIDDAALLGLFKDDYHYNKIQLLKSTLLVDSTNKLPADSWANADVLMTDAFTGLLKDLKQGRLVDDSISIINDTAIQRTFFNENINKIKSGNDITAVLKNAEPKLEAYRALKSGIKKFVDSMDTKNYTYINFPFTDSLKFIKTVKKRLAEAGYSIAPNADSLAFCNVVKTYQKNRGLVVDGKLGAGVIKSLNITDKQRFNTIAITLDKYKLLPDTMPQKYIWVNLPAYYLKVYEGDNVMLESKVIIGKTTTPTPPITSQITDMVLYPTWTVPTSIIAKDLLPGLKRSTNYLARRGLYLLDSKGKKINAAAINWGKYSKGIPYRVQQASGNSNALGVIKFNFDNPYSVYLHDTNQRYLFSNATRSLSHGCVRVQEWQKLAFYIAQNDSINAVNKTKLRYTADSLTSWLKIKKYRKVNVDNHIAVFIKYFACENKDGKIKFYDDVYGEDRDLKQKYFAKK